MAVLGRRLAMILRDRPDMRARTRYVEWRGAYNPREVYILGPVVSHSGQTPGLGGMPIGVLESL
jgi:hypothetical protein